MELPKILISGSYNAFNEGWNGNGAYMASGTYHSETFKLPIYIGSCWAKAGIKDRIQNGHISPLNNFSHPHNLPLQYGWAKHGQENFVWWLLESCPPDKTICLAAEQKYLDLYRPFSSEFGGFNIQKIAGKYDRNNKSIPDIKQSEEFASKKESFLIQKKKPKPKIIPRKERKIYSVVNSSGHLFTITEIKEFCKEKNLPVENFRPVLNGRRPQYKGWRLANEKTIGVAVDLKKFYFERRSNGRVKPIDLVNPIGDVVTIPHLVNFAKENNLSYKCLRNVILGKIKHHRGWRISGPKTLGIPFDFLDHKKELKYLISPNGEIVEFINIEKFAEENGLAVNSVNKLLFNSRTKSLHGWAKPLII